MKMKLSHFTLDHDWFYFRPFPFLTWKMEMEIFVLEMEMIFLMVTLFGSFSSCQTDTTTQT